MKHSHPSRQEANDCNRLLADCQMGKYASFKYIAPVPLHIGGKTWKSWAIDFKVTRHDGSFFYMESKGWNRSDDGFRLKLAAFLTEYPDTEILVNWRPVTLTPGRRLMCEGLKKRTRAKQRAKRQIRRTYNRALQKWVALD